MPPGFLTPHYRVYFMLKTEIVETIGSEAYNKVQNYKIACILINDLVWDVRKCVDEKYKIYATP